MVFHHGGVSLSLYSYIYDKQLEMSIRSDDFKERR